MKPPLCLEIPKRRSLASRTFKKLRRTWRKVKGTWPARDPRYLRWIRLHPCVVCMRFDISAFGRSDAMHVGEIRGLGQKCSDRETLPGCRFHHREHHKYGREFWKHYQLDRDALIATFNARFEAEVAG